MDAVDVPLWSKDNAGNQGIVSMREQYSNLLINNIAKLSSTIDIHPLWIPLRQLEVVDQRKKKELQRAGKACDQIEELVDHLLKNPLWRFHGFLRALCLSNQSHVVTEIFGLDPEVYGQQKQEQFNKPSDGEQSQESDKQAGPSEPTSGLPSDLQQAITSHREYYERTLMKGYLFDRKELDMRYDMKNCYIQIVAMSDELLSEPLDASPDDILVTQPGDPDLTTALLSGPPGSGKSTFIRNFVYKRSKETPGEWDLIMILNITTLKAIPEKTLKDQIMNAIRQSLHGGRKEVIMKSMGEEKLKVLLIPDGLDECRSKDLMDMLTDLVKNTHEGKYKFTVLATCRSGLCPIKEKFFDRRMKIEGFTRQQGLDYIQHFFFASQEASRQSLFESISTLADEGKLDHILTNPLRTHIFSVVTSDGTLKLKEGRSISLKDLFEATEISMKMRQVEKDQEAELDPQQVSEKIDISDQTERFYSMSLYALMNDIRDFDQDLLNKFQIHKKNPYFTFMKSRQSYDKKFQKVMVWNFTHELFFEYFAARALEALPEENLMCVLLVLCYKKQFRNTQKILFSILGADSAHLDKLTHMMQSTLILQSEEALVLPELAEIKRKATYLVKVLESMPHQLINNNPKMTKGIFRRISSKVTDLLNDIQHFFGDNTEKAKEEGLLYQMKEDHYLTSHLYDCLLELSEENQELIFDQTYNCFLPSIIPKEGGILFGNGRTRWSAVTNNDGWVTIHASSPGDAQKAVKQHLRLSSEMDLHNPTGSQYNLDMYVPCSEGWLGLPPAPADELSSPQPWADLLGEMSGRVRADRLRIFWESRVRCQGLLHVLLQPDTQQYLKHLLVEQEGDWRDVRLENGRIDIQDLCKWTKLYVNQKVVRIKLFVFTCYVDEGSPEDTAAVREVQKIVHGKHELISYGALRVQSGGARKLPIVEDRDGSEVGEGEREPIMGVGGATNGEPEGTCIRQLFCCSNRQTETQEYAYFKNDTV